MGSIYLCGSVEQKQRWLPAMARMEQLGAFGLTEPEVGSGASRGLTTTARRDGDAWVLDGRKKWIGNASFADLTVIWAKDVDDGQVKGFVVEAGSPGFTAAGLARDEHASLAKAFCTVRMRETVGYARELLGGNGILLEHHVGRFVADGEAIYSYEGTREMNTLIVGRAITGLSAFAEAGPPVTLRYGCDRDWGSLAEPRLARGADGGGTTGPMSPSGASSRSTITGAWSLGPLPLRACRSTHAARTRPATEAEASTRSIRIPRSLWNMPAR